MNKRVFSLALLVAVFCTATCLSTSAQAGGKSGWGWAKPLNKRMGAFYTSNRNANFSRSKKTSTRSYYHHRSQHVVYPSHQANPVVVRKPVAPQYVAPQHVIQQSVAPVPRQAVPHHVAPQAAQPVAPTVKSNPVTVPPNPSPQTAAPLPSTKGNALPHRSTTNVFWQ